MEAMPLTAADVGAVMGNNRDGYGYGDGCWFWILILLFAFWGNNGWGNRNNGLETDIDTRFLERDIFNTNQNVSTTGCQTQRDILETKYNLGTQVLENRFNCSQNACTTQKEILQNRYDTSLGLAGIDKDILLGNQNLQAQLSSCCCTLENAIHKEGEATRNLMQQDKIDQLRDQVYTTNQALSNANLANTIINSVRPTPTPAYLTCSPYFAYNIGYGYNNGCGCGCGNSTII